MTIRSNALSVALAAAAVVALGASVAEAGRGKEYFVQDYKFNKPMHGYSGHSGNYFCDYQRLPERRCVVIGGVEKCKIVGWTLRQSCQ